MTQREAALAGSITPEMEQVFTERLLLERDLSQAISTQTQLQPWGQPIISADGTEIEGIELLSRWQHPVQGFIPPFKFIPIAERAMSRVPEKQT